MHINLIKYGNMYVSFDIENLRLDYKDDIRLAITFSAIGGNFIHKEYGTHSFDECTKYLDCLECYKTAKGMVERANTSKYSPFKKERGCIHE